MASGHAKANALELFFETFGEHSHRAMLLIMGAGMQAPMWPDRFCEMLAAAGRLVIRFDARDVGLSTWLDDLPDSFDALRGNAPYTARDMAADALGLLDALGIARAHLVGASLGGIVTECLAEREPERIASITIYAGTPPEPRARFLRYWDALAAGPEPPAERDARITWCLAESRAAAAAGVPFEEERMRALWSALVDRAWHPEGARRHAAVAYFSPRPGPEALRGVPTLVVEGTADPGFEGMRSYAERAGARFLALPDVGHELPARAWGPLAGAIAAHTT